MGWGEIVKFLIENWITGLVEIESPVIGLYVSVRNIIPSPELNEERKDGKSVY